MTNEVRYLYDGNLVLQARDTNNNVLVTYTRGVDFGGGIGTAGGIGGLLARTDENGSTFYHADGSGNITALMNGNGSIVARYLYNPFWKLIGQWGSMASVNEMRFSSMPHDNLSGSSLYPFRAYDPNLQRWVNQDPMGEVGGVNLYGFVFNNPVVCFDTDGRQITTAGIATTAGTATSGGSAATTTMTVLGEGAEVGEGEIAGGVIIGSLPYLGILVAGNDPDANPNGVNAPPDTAASPYGFTGTNGEYRDANGNTVDALGNIVKDKYGNKIKSCSPKKYPKPIGYEGGKPYNDALKKIQNGGDVDLGFIPTEDEALDLLQAAGIDISDPQFRTEDPHGPPSTHDYPHINYPTPSGGKGAIRIQPPKSTAF